MSDSPLPTLGLELLSLVGKPARVTCFDHVYHDRVVRLAGVLDGLAADWVGVEVLDCPELPVPSRVTVEVLVRAEVIWFHTTLFSCQGGHLRLGLPTGVESAERRKQPRVDVNLPVHLNGLGPEPVRALLLDISAGGALVRSPVSAELGFRLKMLFSLGSGLFFQDLPAVVLRSLPAAGGHYSLGLQYMRLDEGQQRSLSAWVERSRQQTKS